MTDYCLSICSADFNEWVLKNASTRHNFSYIWTGEYEIFEWDLGSTFNYAEMAALICPRPFMVEPRPFRRRWRRRLGWLRICEDPQSLFRTTEDRRPNRN